MATRREIYAGELERKESNGAMLRVKSMGDGLLPQYSNDVKIERTAGGPRATVHVYGDNEQEVRERAVRLFFETENDIAEQKIVRATITTKKPTENEVSDKVREISMQLNEELAKEK